MRIKLFIKILICALGTLIIGEGVFFFLAFNQYNAIRANPVSVLAQAKHLESENTEVFPSAGETVSTGSETALKKVTIDGKEYQQNPNVINILICGVDYMSSRANRNLGERSDTIMICAIDANQNKVTLISIHRDTRALVTKVDMETGRIINNEYNKINTAFAYGGGTSRYSYQNTVNCVEKLLNMNGQFDMSINYYVGLNIDGITHIADALGGVTLTLEDDFPGIGNKGNTVTLKGQKAIDFVRERHAFASSDLARIQHQQQFMIALAKKIQKMGAAQSVLKLFDKVTNYVDTNLNTDQMVALAMILDKVKIDLIEHATLPGQWKSPFIWPDENGMNDLIIKTYFTPVP